MAERFGDWIPIWVPFSSWAKTIATDPGGDHGVVALTLHWLKSLGLEHLHPLVKEALEDERLLLLVDGLDEFGDVAAAEAALKSLYLHVENRHCSLVATGRPQVMRELGLGALGWKTAHLCPLSFPQQEEVLRGRLEANDSDVDQVALLMEELTIRPELDDLAETPLFLAHLADLWRAHQAIPVTRPEVHEAVHTGLSSRAGKCQS